MTAKKMFTSIIVIAIFFIFIPDISYAKTNGVPDNFVAPNHIYTESEVLVDHPVGQIIKDNPEDPISMAKTQVMAKKSGSVIYGPYRSIYLDDSKMQVIFSALRLGNNIPRVNYQGVNCFKFQSGNTIIYIASDSMNLSLNSLCTGINSVLSSNANNRNTGWVYTNTYQSYQYSWNGNTIYRTTIARVGVQVYYNSSNQIYLSVKVFDSIAFDVYETFIHGSTYISEANIRPTPVVNITNTGTSNSIYFGGYEIQGVGNNTSTTSIGSLVDLGYKFSNTIGSITSLSISSIYKLYNDLVSLTKYNSNGRKFYYTMPVSLSNPAQNKFSYSCTSPSPFTLGMTNDYLTLKIGTIGKQVSTTKYDIRCNINFY